MTPLPVSDGSASWAGRALVRPKTYEAIADDILDAVRSGTLSPGDPVPTERELTSGYQVGRSSVREALRMLESKGVIVSAGRNSFVVAEIANPLTASLKLLTSLQRSTLRDLYQLRRALEGEAAGLAAANRRPADLKEMERALESLEAPESAQDQDSGEAQIDADLRFHLAIAAATGNGLISAVMDAIRGMLQHALGTVMDRPGGVEAAVSAHRAILAAITDADPDAARRAMLCHLASVEDSAGDMLDRPALPDRSPNFS